MAGKNQLKSMTSNVYKVPLISGSLSTYWLHLTALLAPFRTLVLLSDKGVGTLSLLFASLFIERKLDLCTSK